MYNIEKLLYKGYTIFFFDRYYAKIGKLIIDNEYLELKKIKNTKRNYVSLIEINGEKFVYKEPRNEFRIPQRQLMTFFKKGEALTTLINVNKMIEKFKIKDYAKPYLAIVKRKNNFIVFSAILLEYIQDGKELTKKNIEIIVEKIKDIHKLGYYHGDFNPTNFLIDKNNTIKILDTQAKKMGLSNYRAHYDMLTMQENYSEMKYPYSKSFSYYFALSIKKFKRLKWVENIKKKKKDLRDKGWRI